MGFVNGDSLSDNVLFTLYVDVFSIQILFYSVSIQTTEYFTQC